MNKKTESIINHIGGAGRYVSMISAFNFVETEKGLKFQFKGSNKASFCIIEIENDLYTISFWKYNKKTLDMKKTAQEKGVYAEELFQVVERMFEEIGLRIRL